MQHLRKWERSRDGQERKQPPPVRGVKIGMGGFSPHPIAVYSGRASRVLAEQCEKGLIETDPYLSADVLGCWKGAG